MSEVTKCDIIGHFDLITKFIEQDPAFDTNHPRYVKAWQQAADELLKTGKPFEINTGAISRGYRTSPYPAKEIRDYIRAHGGKLILSSDAHAKENIAFRFDEWKGYRNFPLSKHQPVKSFQIRELFSDSVV